MTYKWLDQIVDDILNHFIIPSDYVLPSGQTIRDRVKSYVYQMIDSIEEELDNV
jgi:hypothetical protein